MKKVWLALASAVGALVLVLGVGVAANATTEYPPEGGTWEYGVIEPASTVFVYSHYYHPTHLHRASVQVTSGTIYRSPDKSGGQWANVDKPTGYWGNGAWYYRY